MGVWGNKYIRIKRVRGLVMSQLVRENKGIVEYWVSLIVIGFCY